MSDRVLLLFPPGVTVRLPWINLIAEAGLALPNPQATYLREREGEVPWPAVEPWVNDVLWGLSWRLDDTVRALLRDAGRDEELRLALGAAHRLGGRRAVTDVMLARGSGGTWP